MQELIALVPPIERRALVFIDPSFEVKEEYKSIPKIIKTAYMRFATGVFCLWYPIISDYQQRQIHRALQNIGTDKVLRIEFFLRPGVQEGMHACGLWIINPPYVLANEMKILLTFLKNVFNKGISTYHME